MKHMKLYVLMLLFLMTLIISMTGDLHAGEILLLAFWFLIVGFLDHLEGGETDG